MASKSFHNVPILGQKRGVFRAVGKCPRCAFPVFAYVILGGVPEYDVLAFCQHEGEEMELRLPGEEDIELERSSIRYLFSLIYQQQDTLAQALAVALRHEESPA